MMIAQKQISLAELSTGEQGTLISFNDLRNATGRLTSLGFTPEVQVIMTQNYGRGPLLVTVRGTRVALGRQEAEKILVKRIYG